MRWTTMLAALAVLTAAAAQPASAQDARDARDARGARDVRGARDARDAADARGAQDALYVRSLAATCASCHGTDGRVQAGSSVAALAGMPQEQIVAAMMAIKSGTRSATVMYQLSKGYSDAQIVQLAGYFAALPR